MSQRTMNENYTAAQLDNHGINSAGVLDCTVNNETIAVAPMNSQDVTMVEDKEGVIMINPQVSVINESQQTETEGDTDNTKVTMNLESENTSSHQHASFGESDSVNSNYFVLVESSDGSQVISGVIPNILSSSNEESQLSLNTVLQPDISYIDSNNLNRGKEQAGFTADPVTMVIDSNLQTEESQKIFIEPSLIGVNSESISPEQLAMIEKNSEQTLGASLSSENLIIHSDGLLRPDMHRVQVSSQMGDSSDRSQIRIISVSSLEWDSKGKSATESSLGQAANQDLISVQMNEADKQSKEKQRQLSLRLLEQSHLEHQEKLLQRRIKTKSKEGRGIYSDDTEKILKEAGIDDDTPIFSHICAKINPDILLNVPGCQKFLLSEASRNSSTSFINFSSEMDCSFTGDIRDFVSLHKGIKSLLGLSCPSNLVFEKCKDKCKKENKTISCDLLVPYVSSKGRVSKQSSKLIQLGGLIRLEDDSNVSDANDDGKRHSRGYRRKRFLSRNSCKNQQSHHPSILPSDQLLSELQKWNEEEGVVCAEETGKLLLKQNETSLSLDPDAGMNKFALEENAADESCDAKSPQSDLIDPVHRRLLEEQIKCKQIKDENNRLKQMKAAVIAEQKALKQICDEAKSNTSSENENSVDATSISPSPRSNKGRPPKKFDPSESFVRVRPRNPLTESAETKQRRMYEENRTFKYFCDQCSFKTKRQSQFNNHLTYHSKGKGVKYFCHHCDFVSISLPALKQHELLHKSKRNLLRCEICLVYVTDKKYLMQKHLKLKHSNKETSAEKYPCHQCSATFSTKTALGRHKMVVHVQSTEEQSAENSETNTCSECKKTFSKKIHLHRHIKDVHGPQNRPHLCDTCGSSFKRKDALQQHKVVHLAKSARVLPFKCNKCDKAFRSQAHLKEHSSIHSTERPFLCQYCGASFKTQPVQRKHILTLHIQPRTHVCAVCCRQFNTKNALHRHENTHKSANDDQTMTDEGLRPWESEVLETDMKKMQVKAEDGSIGIEVSSNVMVALEEDQATTALVVETEGGTRVMVDPSLVPAMMAPDETHSSRAGTLEVQQALIPGGQAEQAFYYLADEHLQNIQ